MALKGAIQGEWDITKPEWYIENMALFQVILVISLELKDPERQAEEVLFYGKLDRAVPRRLQ